jgi:teichoic acid transport system permease protein
MRDRGRLTAPGDLLNGPVLAPGPDTLTGPDGGGRSLAELADEYGLRPSSAQPGLVSYLKMVWQRRHFILAYATARNVSMYTEARLGQLWQVLTPLLNSGVYYLIFGVLFKANRGISNYTAYLVTGVFIFAFTERSIDMGAALLIARVGAGATGTCSRAALRLPGRGLGVRTGTSTRSGRCRRCRAGTE